MMLGLSISAFTTLHVLISLVGLAAGVVVLAAMLANRHDGTWTAVFLVTTLATSVTGFMFPFDRIGPAHVVGLLSLAVLAAAIFALQTRRLTGIWRQVYVVASVIAFYLNAFVAVVQAFQKIGFLADLAPTQSEPPFQIAQLAVLAACAATGYLAVRRFRPAL
ncbi:MAG: hypothetical protein HY059_20845 [Proteobacteria bacterium]|nr:hypothetical protein [Pseudomonadota bacterium]